ncbi:hypothetical protein THASP1DRAFT_23061 [Thamnocephalis sphaerospora]|uniref:F-box domain-containing protein n=1 Tax=Thamnocephalis sphaerospora TaxID=78915 RepID=A0A4P9XSE9_9FUNG|nr:hypothetical protein THASP1DRAFT_23061 [Thamnocephalis sphaerospora]|eukprot:RKP09047.1 hypothetical protein THASP1DRAFT_23061 [Thamnocephalis sphaerospora]
MPLVSPPPSLLAPFYRLGVDEILHVCLFLEEWEYVLLAATCRRLYQCIAKREAYWERRYRREFRLHDWRERSWLAWFNEQTDTTPSLMTLAQSTSPEHKEEYKDLVLEFGLPRTHWYHAYHRRRLTMRNLIAGRARQQECTLPVDDDVKLIFSGMHAWTTLIREQNGLRMWVVHNNTRSKGLQWQALEHPHKLGSLTHIDFADCSTDHAAVCAKIKLHPPAPDSGVTVGAQETDVEQADDDQESDASNDTRYAVFSWAFTPNASPVTICVQSAEESKMLRNFSPMMGMYGEWLLIRTLLAPPATTAATTATTTATAVMMTSDADADGAQTSAEPDDGAPKEEMPDVMCRYQVYNMEDEHWYASTVGKLKTSFSMLQHVSMRHLEILTVHMSRVEATDQPTGSIQGTAVDTCDNRHCDKRLIRLDWELNKLSYETKASQLMRTGAIHLPPWQHPSVETREFGPTMTLAIIYDVDDKYIYGGGAEPHALLSLFALDKSLDGSPEFQDAAQQALAQSRTMWVRFVETVFFTSLYSEELVVSQQFRRFDVLSALDGTLLRKISCEPYNAFGPILGAFCGLQDGINGENWLVDMSNGEKYLPSPKWQPAHRQPHVEQSDQDSTARPASLVPDNILTGTGSSGYRVSTSNVARVNPCGGGQYQIFQLTEL